MVEVSGKIDICLAPPATGSPKVTAIVSTYQSERFIRGCLEDLEAQTIAGQMEIIVVDSASPQNERQIVEEFQQRHSNITYVRTTERETLYAAWNRGIGMARAPYITNANADDRHAPDAFEKLARILETRPEIDVVYASTDITECENSALGTAKTTGCFRARKFDRRRLFRDCLPGPQPMWRRSLHDRFGLFDETFVSAGDYEFWLRISEKARFCHIPEVLGLFWDSPNSISHSSKVAVSETALARDRHWPSEWGPRIGEKQSLLDRFTRRSTYRNLARDLLGRVAARKSP